MTATPQRRPFDSLTRSKLPFLPHTLLPLQIQQPLDCPAAGQWITLKEKVVKTDALYVCQSDGGASICVLSMFSGSEKEVISLSHFLKCFHVSSCRDKSRAWFKGNRYWCSKGKDVKRCTGIHAEHVYKQTKAGSGTMPTFCRYNEQFHLLGQTKGSLRILLALVIRRQRKAQLAG